MYLSVFQWLVLWDQQIWNQPQQQNKKEQRKRHLYVHLYILKPVESLKVLHSPCRFFVMLRDSPFLFVFLYTSIALPLSIHALPAEPFAKGPDDWWVVPSQLPRASEGHRARLFTCTCALLHGKDHARRGVQRVQRGLINHKVVLIAVSINTCSLKRSMMPLLCVLRRWSCRKSFMSFMLWPMYVVRTEPYWQVFFCGSLDTRGLKRPY